MCTLNHTLENHPMTCPVKLSLPIAHLTTGRSFLEIIEAGQLNPQPRPEFDGDLLYFSYGGVFHRLPRDEDDEETTQLPVAFLFKPDLLKRIEYFFPYDTGAAAKGKFPIPWSKTLRNFDNYRICNDAHWHLPSQLVCCLYGSHENYLNGEVGSGNGKSCISCSERLLPLQVSLTTLLEFLTADLTRDIDHRQWVIECQTSHPIILHEVFSNILWLGMPDRYKPNFDNLCRQICTQLEIPPTFPRNEFYPSKRWIKRPSEICSMLEDKAHEIVKEYLQWENLDNANQ
jgi:hypothetical protein